MKIIKLSVLALLLPLVLISCKKDYVIGGSLFKPTVNKTTYEYLKTNHLFDTLVVMIDKMNLKNEVNASGTFFALTNYSIHNYVSARQAQLRVSTNNENLVYTFDSLNLLQLKDSLRAYMFKEKYTSTTLTAKGVYPMAVDGEKRLIQLLPSSDYTSGIFTTQPQYIFLTKIAPLIPGGPLPGNIDSASRVQPRQLLKALCQTTGIITTTGVLHVLNNNHTFTFFDNVNN